MCISFSCNSIHHSCFYILGIVNVGKRSALQPKYRNCLIIKLIFFRENLTFHKYKFQLIFVGFINVEDLPSSLRVMFYIHVQDKKSRQMRLENVMRGFELSIIISTFFYSNSFVLLQFMYMIFINRYVLYLAQIKTKSTICVSCASFKITTTCFKV